MSIQGSSSFFEGWIEIQYIMSYKCSVPKTFIKSLLESFSQTLIRQFFTAKYPEIAAKFEEKEKEDGLIKPDQVKSFSKMNEKNRTRVISPQLSKSLKNNRLSQVAEVFLHLHQQHRTTWTQVLHHPCVKGGVAQSISCSTIKAR